MCKLQAAWYFILVLVFTALFVHHTAVALGAQLVSLVAVVVAGSLLLLDVGILGYAMLWTWRQK